MKKARKLSSLDRVVAACLAVVWLGGGAIGACVALIQGRWAIGIAAAAAVYYGAAWLRVVARSRPLTWAEFVTPWRRSA